jgi:hypothetical protein
LQSRQGQYKLGKCEPHLKAKSAAGGAHTHEQLKEIFFFFLIFLFTGGSPPRLETDFFAGSTASTTTSGHDNV